MELAGAVWADLQLGALAVGNAVKHLYSCASDQARKGEMPRLALGDGGIRAIIDAHLSKSEDGMAQKTNFTADEWKQLT